MPSSADLRESLAAALAEALQVGDSPVRADRLIARLSPLLDTLDSTDISDDLRARVRAAIENAVRVLRRDDDGREAARHLRAASELLQERPRRPSPFLDD